MIAVEQLYERKNQLLKENGELKGALGFAIDFVSDEGGVCPFHAGAPDMSWDWKCKAEYEHEQGNHDYDFDGCTESHGKKRNTFKILECWQTFFIERGN